MNKPSLAVIGAGISGLTLANKLKDQFDITVYEKSRGVGGRMATRTANPFQFDHGAQFFTAKSENFKKFLKPFIDKKIVTPWEANFIELNGNKVTCRRDWANTFEHYVGAPTMTSLCKALSEDINVQLETTISKCSFKNHQWQIESKESSDVFIHDWVIFAMPVAQILSLIPDEVPFKAQLPKYKMSSCTTLMLGFEQTLELDWEAALVRGADISWISVNSSKPQRTSSPTLVVHSTNDWSDQNIACPIEQAKDHLIKELQNITGLNLNSLVHQDIHRWRYANILKQEGPQSFLSQEFKVGAVGDWCIRGFVEGAFKSASNLVSDMST